ncbi:hypothetical protein F2Q69_00044415 [Brassica cretica]|uniref:Uncharacterized protein n=1 Tax=Brassica cretica TaxID=69181 RepID=A0A8S9NC66_BRACR|nr:hypothetical protein F2Q69_00044415 [Brassica cretica]
MLLVATDIHETLAQTDASIYKPELSGVTDESHHKKNNGSSGQSRDWLNSDTSEVCAALVTRSSPDLRVFSPLDSTRQVGVKGSSL